MISITGELMSEDKVIATVKNGVITGCDNTLLPLYLKRTRDGLHPVPLIPTEQTQDC